jgi:hypothetical protein
VETASLKTLLAIEPKWTVSLNDLEYLDLRSSDITIEKSTIQFGKYTGRMLDLEWLRPNIIRIRTQLDTITLYTGDHLPSTAGLRRRRRTFQIEISRALRNHFGVRNIERQALYSDRRHGIGGAYPRFLIADHAVIAVDPQESSPVINGIMRAAVLWAPLVRRPVVVIVPQGRHQTLSARLRVMKDMHGISDWLTWNENGETLRKLEDTGAEPETRVKEFETGKIEEARRDPSINADHAHQERWLESKLIGSIRQVIPDIDTLHIYPQVPSFVGEERNVIDLLTVTNGGRLVVIEIKALPDPDLPFQALDYWIAVERHRKSGDFLQKGYFGGRTLKNEPALLVLVAPLLAYHKTAGRLLAAFPREVPLLEIGINQTWKREIKVLRRKGMLG